MKNRISKKTADNILNGSILKALIFLGVPIIINSLLQTMYNLTDTYWLGKLPSEEPMAAISLISPMQNVIINFGQGFNAAGAILIAQLLGAGDKQRAKKMANQVFTVAMVFALVCASLCFLFTPYIVGWLGAEGNIFSYSRTYLQIVVCDMPFLYMINIYSAINQARGNTFFPMVLNFCGIAINMILDPIFLMVFKMGIMGVALATLISKIPCAIAAFILLSKKKEDIHLDRKFMAFDKNMVLKIIKVGLPTALGSSTMQFGFLLMSKNVFKYGSSAMAAYGIGNKISGIITTPSNAVGSAVGTIVGQNIGAGRYDRAEKAYKLGRNIAVCFLFCGGMILSRNVFSRAIVSVFSNDGQNDVINYASEFLSIMLICCWTNGVHNSTTGLFQGSGHTLVTMTIDATRLWVFRFLTLFVCERVLNMGVRSIWYSVVVSNAISALILYILFLTGLWKKDTIGITRQKKGV
ncbi:MAG: MATE family efflux transporter [Firmicutes bacterium]|nr:MATE family efflux transporter [Bacillota bacterium]